MADGTNQTQAGEEPSMEEILASIRKIISDDNPPAEEPKAAEEDIIDLTSMMQDDGSVVDLAAAPVEEDHGIEISGHDEPAEPAAPLPPLEPVTPNEPLVSKPVVDAAVSSLAALTSTLEIERIAAIPSHGFVGNGGRTLEDMVLELMRPLLKQWLDQNLPATVERVVQKEVERITRRSKD